MIIGKQYAVILTTKERFGAMVDPERFRHLENLVKELADMHKLELEAYREHLSDVRKAAIAEKKKAASKGKRK